ncbi:MAG: hypothetical protein KIT87_22280 [Anaerolineae bacterium]|nr:hypothetical protein [Anaerolineae bacterium]
MFQFLVSRPVRVALVAVAALLALTLVSSGALAAPACKAVSGKFTLQAVNDPGCMSPVGLCATGEYQGSIKAISSFVGSAFLASADTPTTGVVFATGDNTIQTDKGDIYTKDAITLRTTGEGAFAEVDTVVGGTGEYAGASGVLTATGMFLNGSGAGVYSGQVCSQ